LSLAALTQRPFELLLELERLARAAVSAREGQGATDEWVGIGFRLGTEHFVTDRADIREVLPVPDPITRVPGGKFWLRGIANVRGQLLTVVDLKAFLGAGSTVPDRRNRILIAASREVPTALIVDEVVGFRRFSSDGYRKDVPGTVIRCDRYLAGGFEQGPEIWPRFSIAKLLEDEQFLTAGEAARK